jgi:hypothetical protein
VSELAKRALRIFAFTLLALFVAWEIVLGIVPTDEPLHEWAYQLEEFDR